MPKRKRATSSGSVSSSGEAQRAAETSIPPPSKFKRVDDSALVTILSWNVETSSDLVETMPQSTNLLDHFESNLKIAPSPLRDLLKRHRFPTALCCQEIRALPQDKDLIRALKLTVNQGRLDGEPSYDAHFCLCTVKNVKSTRRFGVVTYVRDDLAVIQARQVDWDSEGRIIIVEMEKWALINVYAYNGSDAPWKDADGVIKCTRNERKREFNRLLLEECLRIQSRGLAVVLIGDFNISLAAIDCFPRLRTESPHVLARKLFNEEFIPQAKVIDVFRVLYKDKKSYSWFSKSKPHGEDCARVDYALVQESHLDHVVDIEYFQRPLERGSSDHAPLLLTLKDMNKL